MPLDTLKYLLRILIWIKTGANGVVPAKAEALIDCRLVPDQDPEKVFQCIKRHVEMMGYDNVKIENDGYIPSSKTDVNTPYLPAVEEICRDVKSFYSDFLQSFSLISEISETACNAHTVSAIPSIYSLMD